MIPAESSPVQSRMSCIKQTFTGKKRPLWKGPCLWGIKNAVFCFSVAGTWGAELHQIQQKSCCKEAQ